MQQVHSLENPFFTVVNGFLSAFVWEENDANPQPVWLRKSEISIIEYADTHDILGEICHVYLTNGKGFIVVGRVDKILSSL